jgi:hypothetical protein
MGKCKLGMQVISKLKKRKTNVEALRSLHHGKCATRTIPFKNSSRRVSRGLVEKSRGGRGGAQQVRQNVYTWTGSLPEFRAETPK